MWWMSLMIAGANAHERGVERPRMRNGLSVGLSAGAATGFGPTVGIPLGYRTRVQLTALPILLPEAGGGGSGGVRLQQFVGDNPRSRLYVVAGGGIHGWSDVGGFWGAGLGMGVETRKDWTSGRTAWVDVSLTVLSTGEGDPLVLPLPQAGISWLF